MYQPTATRCKQSLKTSTFPYTSVAVVECPRVVFIMIAEIASGIFFNLLFKPLFYDNTKYTSLNKNRDKEPLCNNIFWLIIKCMEIESERMKNEIK